MQAKDFSQYSGALESKSQILSVANKEQVIIPWKQLDYAGAQSRKTLGDSLSLLRKGILVLWGGWGERKGPALFVRPHVNAGEADVLGKNSLHFGDCILKTFVFGTRKRRLRMDRKLLNGE